jgi:gluconolactonase
MLWAEGCAWNGVGKYLLWSDIPNNRQFRWIEDDERVTTFRKPANNSNGNTFDFQGRQIACEHGTRRVARYEHDGSVTVLADKWNGKRLNAPNDAVVHPNGDIWFTDPGYGSMGHYEGHKGDLDIQYPEYRGAEGEFFGYHAPSRTGGR